MLDPIVKTITLPTTPARAFELFTSRIADWWPLTSHSVFVGKGETPASVAFEPYEGGRLIETGASGETSVWGEVTTWTPGRDLGFTWHPGSDPAQATQVDVSFRPADAGGTRVRLVHANWERLGDAAAAQHERYTPGWDKVFHDGFEQFANRSVQAA